MHWGSLFCSDSERFRVIERGYARKQFDDSARGGLAGDSDPCLHTSSASAVILSMEESVVVEVPNELVVGFLTLTLSAKGVVALWMVVPVSAILIALAWRIWRPRG
jgi:hypothetical protein